MALETDFELGEVALIVGAVALIGYFIYHTVSGLTGAGGDTTAGGAQEGVIGNVLNDTLTIGQGGGTYTDAAKTVLTDPVGSIKSILGF